MYMDKLTAGDATKYFPNHYKLGEIIMLSQIGKQGKSVQVYKFASSVNRALFTTFAHVLVGAASPIPFEHHLAMMATRSFGTLL